MTILKGHTVQRNSKCKKCSGKDTVEWDPEYHIWICWKCGWIDKQKKAKR